MKTDVFAILRRLSPEQLARIEPERAESGDMLSCPLAMALDRPITKGLDVTFALFGDSVFETFVHDVYVAECEADAFIGWWDIRRHIRGRRAALAKALRGLVRTP